MFVATGKSTIANDMVNEVREAFRARPHLVDSEAGFVRVEVMSPFNFPSNIWLMTYWEDEACFRRWHHSHQYHEAHLGIPKGPKLVPERAGLCLHELFAV